MTSTFKQQRQFMELEKVNQQGFVDHLRGLVEKRKRPQHDVDNEAAKVPMIEDVLRTLRAIEKHEAAVRAVIGGDL